MKILHIITGLNTGGAEKMLVKLIKSTNQIGMNHSVISLLDRGTQGEILEKMNIPVNSLNMKQGIPSLSKLIRLRKIIDNEKPDIIQSWMYHANIAAYLSNFQKKIPLIFNVRHALNDYKNEKKSLKIAILLNSFFSSKIDAIVYNSDTSKKQHEKFGFKINSSDVIPNGFETKLFKPNNRSRQMVRTNYKVRQDEILVGAVGRNHKIKGFEMFLKSCSLIAKKKNKVKFIVIGRGVKEDKRLKELSFSLGLRNLIILENERDDLESVWPALDIYCNSSHSEAFSNTIGEAMLNEIPCVVTNVGDSSKIVANTGLVVPPNSPNDMADAVISLMNLGKDDFYRMGKIARIRIIENFSIEKIAGNYVNLYSSLLEKYIGK